MLTRNRLAGALMAAAALTLGSLVAAPSALAEGDAECRDGVCVVKGETPKNPGGGDLGTEPVVDPGTIAPAQPLPGESNYCQEGPGVGPLKCQQNIDPVLNCIWRLMSPQLPPPPGKDPSRGAWEECVPAEDLANAGSPGNVLWPGSQPGGGKAYPQRWWEGALGQDGQVAPEQAARQLVAQMDLQGIEIGMVPRSLDADVNAMGAVGLPAWMWVENTGDAKSWGPHTVTRQIEGLTVTGTARPRNITWDMGDGARVVCQNAGTPYNERYGRQESPTCGHTYEKTGNYTVTALTTWQVEWSAAGDSGVLETITRSSEPVLIGELQAVNVAPRG